MKFESQPNQESMEQNENHIEISVAKKEASIVFHNLELDGQYPKSPELEIVVEKQPIELVEGGVYSGNAILFDAETEKMQSLASQAENLRDLPESERLGSVLRILRSEVNYAYNEVLEKVADTDPDLAKWVAENTGLNAARVYKVPLSEIIEKGYGVCRHLAPAYLWLAQKAGLKGAILNSDQGVIKNIERSDNHQPLFKSVEVGDTVAAHAWVEIKTSDGRWIPVDPSTGLVGDSDEGLAMFKEANYMAYATKPNLNVKAEPEDKLRQKGTTVLFEPAEATTSGVYCLELSSSKPKFRFGQGTLPPTNEPYSGEGKLSVTTTAQSGEFALDIIEIKEKNAAHG